MSSILSRHFELAREGAGRNNLGMEGLRGFAVFLVFLVHYVTLARPFIGDGATAAVSEAAFLIGNSGVDLFFVLSGYLIYGSLISRAQPYRTFMRRRAERIYPAFLVVLAAYLVLSFVYPSESKIPSSWPAGTAYFAANLLLLPGIFPLVPMVTVAWSLSYEMFFYLATPPIIGLLRMRGRRPAPRLAFLVAIAWLLAGYSLLFGGHPRLLLFVAGAALYEFLDGKLRSAPGLAAALAATAVGWAALFLPWHGQAWQIVKTGALACAFPILCHHVFIRGDSPLGRSLRFTPLRWLGNMSYSYYLVHGLALKAAFLLAERTPLAGMQSSAVFWLLLPPLFAWTLLPSAALFLLVERPFSLARRKAEPQQVPERLVSVPVP